MSGSQQAVRRGQVRGATPSSVRQDMIEDHIASSVVGVSRNVHGRGMEMPEGVHSTVPQVVGERSPGLYRGQDRSPDDRGSKSGIFGSRTMQRAVFEHLVHLPEGPVMRSKSGGDREISEKEAGAIRSAAVSAHARIMSANGYGFTLSKSTDPAKVRSNEERLAALRGLTDAELRQVAQKTALHYQGLWRKELMERASFVIDNFPLSQRDIAKRNLSREQALVIVSRSLQKMNFSNDQKRDSKTASIEEVFRRNGFTRHDIPMLSAAEAGRQKTLGEGFKALVSLIHGRERGMISVPKIMSPDWSDIHKAFPDMKARNGDEIERPDARPTVRSFGQNRGRGQGMA